MWRARVGVAVIAIAGVATGVRGDTCKDADRDEDGKCPAKPAAPARPPAASSCPAGMVHVAAGSLSMGSPDGAGGDNQHPQHKVTLSGFCIDKTEVTVAAWAQCASNRGCPAAPTTKHMPGQDDNEFAQYHQFCNGSKADRRRHPINCVDWKQAKTYCAWAGKRLPTEAEWEYAARGSDDRTYPWGNDAPSARRLNACGSECIAMSKRLGIPDGIAMYDGDDDFDSTAPVGSFPDGASPFGALDMAGNVYEWTADGYGNYSADAATNPTAAGDGSSRVIRGGGWLDSDTGLVRAAFRIGRDPGVRNIDLGFRCARGG